MMEMRLHAARVYFRKNHGSALSAGLVSQWNRDLAFHKHSDEPSSEFGRRSDDRTTESLAATPVHVHRREWISGARSRMTDDL
jgi:hypothetical protein